MTAGPRPLAGVLVAAGRGRRMGGDKLWLESLGRPVWRWSLDALLAVVGMETVAVVVPPDAIDRFSAALPPGEAGRCRVVAGGEVRADSVRAGLAALETAGIDTATVVLVHDAARPAAGPDLMTRVAEAASSGNGAIPVIPVRDTLKRVRDGMVTETVDRVELVGAQTPQAASLGILRAALDAAHAARWAPTDEAAALQAIGVPVHAVEGDPTNAKLTEPGDAPILWGVLRGRAHPLPAPHLPGASVRVGMGIDAHRWADGPPLRLGGLTFPDEPRGLAGHSDGDAAFHAVIDAVLGAAGLGDVGAMFPSTDDAWRGADSAELLRRAVARAREAGWHPQSVDIAIAAARPSISSRRDEMARAVAEAMGIDPAEVSVRGTTTDGLGFPGTEGVAAWAVAVLQRPA